MTMFRQAMQSLRRTTLRTLGGGAIIVGTLEVTTHLPSQGRSSELYHNLSDNVVTPMLQRFLNPEQAHDLAIRMANYAPTHRPSAIEQRIDVSSTLWGRLDFPNSIGLAAGFDKDGETIESLLKMGFGFVEIGSVTLKPQPGNPSPRMFRLVEDEGIINRYGFNSMGADAVEGHLKAYREAQQQRKQSRTLINDLLFGAPPQGLLGINLGKNKTSATPLADYQALILQLGPYADYLVINVSSPNTPGLRDLQESSSLEELLKGCQKARDELPMRPPLLVKLSPDLTDDELQEIANVLMNLKMDGIILTNTTTERPPSLISLNQNETGGLSGRPLQQRSTDCIRKLYQWTNGSIPIIGVGGIFDGTDVHEKLRAGASLVQVYSGMVYRGPGMLSKLRHELAELMLQNGQRRLQDVIGIDHHELYWQKRQEEVVHTNQKQHETMLLLQDDDDDGMLVTEKEDT
jgi:dihydroorotate dehydrogenase